MSHPRFKATWVAIAAGSIAGLAVLGACSDEMTKVAGPRAPSSPANVFGVVGGNHHKITVCVDPLSDAGPGNAEFTFNVAANTQPGFQTITATASAATNATSVSVGALALPISAGEFLGFSGGTNAHLTAPAAAGATTLTVDPLLGPIANGETATLGAAAWFEYPFFPADPDLVTPGFLEAQNKQTPGIGSLGPFPLGGGSDQVITTVTAGPGECEDVFIRQNTCPGGTCSTNDPFDNSGNRLWTLLYGQGVVNPFGAVNISAVTPSGYTKTIQCTNDDPNLPQYCTDGGFTSANVFHGSSFTYKFTAPPETPCPAGTFTWEIADAVNETNYPAGQIGDILVRYDQFPAPNDNSYGINAVGWPNGHTFGNLTGSDKAGIQIRNAASTIVLSFEVDYLSSFAAAPSGYKSLCVTGGDGGMLIGSATGIQCTTSLANNLNNINIPGLFSTNGLHTQLIPGTPANNILVNSPPTDPQHLTYNISDPAFAAWDFHDTYYVRINPSTQPQLAGFNASTWTVEPNLTVLHNSPAKPCPPGPFPCSDITIGAKSGSSKEVKVDVNNVNLSTDAFVTGVHITWPAANGALKSIKIGGDVIWSGTINGTSANLALADLVADANKRKIGKKSDEDVKFTFANNVSTNMSLYTGSLDFGDNCNVVILP